MSIEDRPDTPEISEVVDVETSDPDASFEDIVTELHAIGLSCDTCHKQYKSKLTLESHRRLKHPRDNVEVRCASCEKIYSSIMSLRKHMHYKHRYQHRCKVCYRAFPTPQELDGHGQACSKRESPCVDCGKVFTSQFSLRTHQKYKHPEVKANWCELCRRAFSTARGLVNHARIIHLTAGTSCVECSREFITVAALRSHRLYKHTRAEAQIRCSHCRRMFADRSALTKHVNSSHAMRYVCGVCSYTCMTSEQLVHHVVTQHEKHVQRVAL